jgi:hypothetical protein
MFMYEGIVEEDSLDHPYIELPDPDVLVDPEVVVPGDIPDIEQPITKPTGKYIPGKALPKRSKYVKRWNKQGNRTEQNHRCRYCEKLFGDVGSLSDHVFFCAKEHNRLYVGKHLLFIDNKRSKKI